MENAVRVILIVIAVAVIIAILVFCAAIGVIVLLALTGPAIGNVFSNIVDNISLTPTVVP